MGLTLNQILGRIKSIVTAHKMVRQYDVQGVEQEFNNEHTALYPSVNVLVQPGNISASLKTTTFGFVIDFEDLVNVSTDTKTNEWDVVSDMASIAEDIMAQLNNPAYSDWTVSKENQLQPFFDNDNDRAAGVRLTISISSMYTADRCQVPSETVLINENETNVKVYDLEYIADGTEGSTLNITALLGKKIILITREMSTLHKVSNAPDSAQYTWNDTLIMLGAVTNSGERFLILYRNY